MQTEQQGCASRGNAVGKELQQPGGDIVSKSSRQSQTLDSILVKALVWTGGMKWAVQVLTWTSMLVLARLLTPTDYGIVGMAGVYNVAISYISEFGIGTAIITARDISREQLAEVNSFAVGLGTVAMVLSWLAAKPLSLFFHTPVIAPLVIVSSVVLLIESLRCVPNAWLSKNLNFRYLAVAEAVKALASSAVSLTMAFLGCRYWSLVAAYIAGSALMCAIILRRARIRYRKPCWSRIRNFIVVGQNVMIGNLAWYGYSNADFFTAGRLLGPAALGAYTNAWTIATAPIEKIASVTNRVTPSFFSAIGNDDSGLRRYMLRLTEFLALLLLPAFCGIVLVSSDFVHLAFGVRWEGMVGPLRLLAVYAGLSCLSTLLSPVMNARGYAGYNRNISLIALLILPFGFYVGGKLYGTIGIAGAWVVLYPLVLVPSYVKVFRIIHLSVREYFGSLAPALSGTVIMFVVIYILKAALPAQMPLAYRFAAVVLAGVATYSASLVVLHRKTVSRVMELVRAQHGKAVFCTSD